MGDWLIDDAGISFAYARNLASGVGLVAQPGAEPVEGFSNPLWTLTLAACFGLGLFHPLWTPKLLSLALVGLAFVLVARTAPRRGPAAWLAGAAPLWLALDTSFVVWTTSGLENPLLVFLLASSVTLALRFGEANASAATPALAGVVAGLLALTRPDALVFSATLAFLLVVLGPRDPRVFAWHAGAFLLGAAGSAGPYLAFRRLYFGDWLPNTFYAKVRPPLISGDPSRLLEPLSDAAGRLAPLVLLVVAFAVAVALRPRRPESRLTVVLVAHLAAAAFVYVALPPDWMGEHRFATAFFLFLYWLTGHGLAKLADVLPRRPGWRALVPIAALLLLAEGTRVHADRSTDFARSPTVPFARIAEFGRAYDALAASLPAGRGSLLSPDMGGTLFEARHLRIHDLAGLCDRTVARTLMDDTRAFHDYVFETLEPTFIHVHKSWAGWAAIHEDARFERDYAALHEDWGGGEDGEPSVGDYVRRDAVTGAHDLERLRADFVRLGLDRPLP